MTLPLRRWLSPSVDKSPSVDEMDWPCSSPPLFSEVGWHIIFFSLFKIEARRFLEKSDRPPSCESPLKFQQVFRTNDILVWIRIRGSMPLTNGSGFGSGSCYFHHWSSRCQQKTVWIKVFLTIFACQLKDPDPDLDSYLCLMNPDSDLGGPKTCGSRTLVSAPSCTIIGT